MIRITFSRIVALLLLSLACFGQDRADQTISHEEEVVRAAYARLSCAAQIGYAWHQTNEGRAQAEASTRSFDTDRSKTELRFEVTDFESGQLRSLSNSPWTSLVSGPVKILNAEYKAIPSGLPESGAHVFYADTGWESTVHENVADLVKPDHVITQRNLSGRCSSRRAEKDGHGMRLMWW